MPLVTTEDVLQLAVDAAAATQELSNLALFAPAAIAAGILLEIFKTIQKIQSNKADCHRLANRCLSLLRRVHDQMDGRWEDSPPSLLKALKAFETTLDSIQVFLVGEASKSWHVRLRRKRSIEKALHSFSVRLDDAERSFQIATLINIHYAVGDKSMSAPPQNEGTDGSPSDSLHKSSSKDSIYEESTLQGNVSPAADKPYFEGAQYPETSELTAPPTMPDGHGIHTVMSDGLSSVIPQGHQTVLNTAHADNADANHPDMSGSHESDIASPTATTRPRERHPVMDADGFRRYHQSELLLRGLSRSREGWWAGTVQAEVDGQQVIVKRYEGARDGALERWKDDADILRRYKDGATARMLGYSQDSCMTPFIVLANASLQLPEGLSN